MKSKRKEAAKHILANLDKYKSCELCNAIVPKENDICPECYAYRFCEDKKVIEDRVVEFAAREQRALGHDKQFED